MNVGLALTLLNTMMTPQQIIYPTRQYRQELIKKSVIEHCKNHDKGKVCTCATGIPISPPSA